MNPKTTIAAAAIGLTGLAAIVSACNEPEVLPPPVQQPAGQYQYEAEIRGRQNEPIPAPEPRLHQRDVVGISKKARDSITLLFEYDSLTSDAHRNFRIERNQAIRDVSISSGIDDYSARISSGQLRLSSFTFDAISVFYDEKYKQVVAFGQDANFSPSKLVVLNSSRPNGAIFDGGGPFEPVSLFHKGHIKGVVQAYGVDTPRGSNQDFLVVAAASNIDELVGNADYVPVAFLVERRAGRLTVVSYLQLGPKGQPHNPSILLSSEGLQLYYVLNVDGQRSWQALKFSQFFEMRGLANAARFAKYFTK